MGKLHLFVDGDDLSSLDETWFAKMRARSAVRPLSSGWSSEQNGGVHRLLWQSYITPGDEKILDTSIDWRDRVCFILGATTAWGVTFPAWTACYPGGSREYGFRDLGEQRVWLTGTGATSASAGSAGYHLKLNSIYHLYARSSDGALCLYRDPGDSNTDPVAFIFRIIASEQTGEDAASTPATQPDPTPTDATPILPCDLNVLQDHGMLAQGMRGSALAIDALPLGPKSTGSPPLPEVWSVHGAERRQPVVGALRRFFVASLGNLEDSIVLDGKADWRDRYVWATGRIEQAASPEAIGPGGLQDWKHNSKEAFFGSTYTGIGEDPDVPLPVGGAHLWRVLELRDSTVETFGMWASNDGGTLILGKDRGDPAIVTGWIEASFPVSSERSSDR